MPLFSCGQSNQKKRITLTTTDIGLHPLPKHPIHGNHLVNIVYFIGIFYHAKSGDKCGGKRGCRSYSALSAYKSIDKADYKIETCQIQHFSHQFGKVTSNAPIKTAKKKPGFLNLD